MNSYELTFHVAEIPAHLADELLDRYDCVIGEDHGGRQYITITAEGVNCVGAAKAMTTQLQSLGMIVQRLEEDLANRNELAERLDVTRQAVGNWVRGERGSDFPPPANDVAGGVWLWGDIARWAEDHGAYDTNGMSYPSRADYDRINGWLVDGCMVAPPVTSEGWHDVAPTVIHVLWKSGFATPAVIRDWKQQHASLTDGVIK